MIPIVIERTSIWKFLVKYFGLIGVILSFRFLLVSLIIFSFLNDAEALNQAQKFIDKLNLYVMTAGSLVYFFMIGSYENYDFKPLDELFRFRGVDFGIGVFWGILIISLYVFLGVNSGYLKYFYYPSSYLEWFGWVNIFTQFVVWLIFILSIHAIVRFINETYGPITKQLSTFIIWFAVFCSSIGFENFVQIFNLILLSLSLAMNAIHEKRNDQEVAFVFIVLALLNSFAGMALPGVEGVYQFKLEQVYNSSIWFGGDRGFLGSLCFSMLIIVQLMGRHLIDKVAEKAKFFAQ